MKRMMIIFAAVIWLLPLSAQGVWTVEHLDGDELKGQEAGDVYVYTMPDMGSFILRSFDVYQFRLTSDVCQFDIEHVGALSGVTVHVGIYDEQGKMTEKFDMWLDRENNKGNRFVRTRNAGTMSNPMGQKGKVKKIFKALQSGKGFVRIVGARFEHVDYDLKILPFVR